MNSAKIKKKIESLKKIKGIVEISKFDTLNRLQKEQKVVETAFERAFIYKQLLDQAEKDFWFKQTIEPKNVVGKIYVFVTIPTSLLDISYARFEHMIKKDFNRENDLLIVLGEPAIFFAREFGIEPLFASPGEKDDYIMISSVISIINFTSKKYVIKFVANSVHVKDKPMQILPFVGNDKLEKSFKKVNYKNLKYFIDPIRTTDKLAERFLTEILSGLIKEAKYYYLKEKLIRHESSLKSVDEKIDTITLELRKKEREVETEELILVSQIVRRIEDE